MLSCAEPDTLSSQQEIVYQCQWNVDEDFWRMEQKVFKMSGITQMPLL